MNIHAAEWAPHAVSGVWIVVAALALATRAEDDVRAEAAKLVGRRFIARTLEKLQAGWQKVRRVNIVALGDSVTSGFINPPGTDVIDVENVYHAQWRRHLARRFNHVYINMISSGLVGDAGVGVESLQREVLDHHPDLVLISWGLNDRLGGMDGLPKFRERLETVVDRIRAAEAEVILLTPNLAIPEGDPVLAAFAQVVRAVAVARQTGLCDIYAAFERRIAAGTPLLSLLSNKINHPTVEGHRIFVRELNRFLDEE